MHGVGFEPTRANTAELETAPLDHSGIHAEFPHWESNPDRLGENQVS